MNYSEVTFVPQGLSIGLLKVSPGFYKPGEILVVPLELPFCCFRTPGAEFITFSNGGMAERFA